MLDNQEFKTLWDVAFLWAGVNQSQENQTIIPVEVISIFGKLIWAYREKRLIFRDSMGFHVDNSIFLNVTRMRLKWYYYTNKYPKAFLEKFYIKRSDLIKWCQEDFTKPPDFWLQINAEKQVIEIESEESLRFNQRCKIACQFIAEQQWKESPNTTIAEMVQHEFIQKALGANYYVPDTIRGWLSEIAPKAIKKPGRPKKKQQNSP